MLNTCLGLLHVEDVGQGPAVLLWPSLFCDGWMWRHQVAALQDRYRLVVIDGPGHGQSPPANVPFSMFDCARAAVDVLDVLNIERVAAVGLSWGGMVAMLLGLRFPSRVVGLAILNSSAEAPGIWLRTRDGLLAGVVRRFGISGLLERPILAALLGKTTRSRQPDLGRELARRFRSWDRRGLADAIRCVLVERADVLAELDQIQVPVQVVGSDEEDTTGSRNIAARVPNAQLDILPSVGHLSALESPHAVTSILERHLARCW